MTNLAGFDVIGEVHMETVLDLLNLLPVTNSMDGSSIYLFGGPFSADLNADLGPLGIATVRLILEATLVAVVHQPLARVTVSVRGGSTSIGGRSLAHIGGRVTADVPLVLAPVSMSTTPPGALPTNMQVPTFLLGATNPVCTLDTSSRTAADGALGNGGADRLTAAVCAAVAAFLAGAGTRSVPAMGFTVVPGIDSNDPQQLSAPPTVAWIDEVTLGVFGYYRAAAGGGDETAKQTSDLGQTQEEFFYEQPGAIAVPGRRVALILSAEAFKLVVACPSIRDRLVRALVEKRDRDAWRTKVHDRDGATILSEVTQAHLFGYLVEEIEKGVGPIDLQEALATAKARIQADVDDIINSRAQTEEETWLTDQPLGRQAVTDALPPPCGDGSVEIIRQQTDAPGAQGDLVAMLRRLEVRLGDGRIAVHFEADASLEDFFGDVWATASGDVDVVITVTEQGVLASSFDVHPPIVSAGATGLTGDLLDTLFTEGQWQAIMAFLSVILQDTLQDVLKRKFPFVPLSLPQEPFATRMADVVIDRDSLLLLGLISRRPRWNEFSPGLMMNATVDRVSSVQPAISGRVQFAATEWGCPAAEFDTTRTFWDTTVSVRAQLRDAPLPVTVLGWQVELGNFSASLVGIDPRPVWSGEPQAIVAEHLTLSGKVNHPDPPIVAIAGPSALGHLQPREDVGCEVTGDRENGWHLQFHGIDGNFHVRLSLDVHDGDGTRWHGETWAAVVGDQLELPPEYAEFKADCDSRYSRWFRLRVLGLGRVGQVQPGQPVTNEETREATAIRTLVAARQPAALGRLVTAAERFGPSILRQVAQVSPTPRSSKLR